MALPMHVVFNIAGVIRSENFITFRLIAGDFFISSVSAGLESSSDHLYGDPSCSFPSTSSYWTTYIMVSFSIGCVLNS